MIYEDYDSVDVVEVTMIKGDPGKQGPPGKDGSGAAYEPMTQSEADARTTTDTRVISAKVLGDTIMTDSEYLKIIKNCFTLDTYSSSNGYEKGDFVLESGKIYEAKQDIASPAGDFTSSKWIYLGEK